GVMTVTRTRFETARMAVKPRMIEVGAGSIQPVASHIPMSSRVADKSCRAQAGTNRTEPTLIWGTSPLLALERLPIIARVASLMVIFLFMVGCLPGLQRLGHRELP